MRKRAWLVHPSAVLILSLAGGFAYAVWVANRFTGAALTGQYVYVVPIVVPFVAFLCDRAVEVRTLRSWILLVDSLVVFTAMMRVIGDVPFVSGHALFLTYAILRRGSLITRITATLVMIEVLYLKLIVWHDFVTPVGGVTLALAAAMLTQRLQARRDAELEEA
jgi:hypothetical protein